MIIGVGHMNLPCPTGPIAIVKLELGYAQIISIDHHGAARTCMFALALHYIGHACTYGACRDDSCSR